MSEAAVTLPNGAIPPPVGIPPAPAPKEPTNPPAVGTEPARDPLSPKFAALARKEQEAVRKLQAAKALEQQIKTEREALAAERAKVDEFNKLLKDDPMEAMRRGGITYEQLTQIQLNNGMVTPEMRAKQLQDRIDAVEAAQRKKDEDAKEALKAQAIAEEQELVKDFQAQIGEHIKTGSAKYPLTNLYNRADMVYYVIDQHFLQTKEIMEIPKAAEIVEKHLRDEVKKAESILKPEPQIPPAKAAKRFAPPENQENWVEKPLKTLTNDVVAAPPPAPTHYLTDEERIQRARARLHARRAGQA